MVSSQLSRPDARGVTMRNTARQTRENRTITVNFQSEASYFQLLSDRKAFLECVLAFVLSLGFQLKHKAACRGGGCPTRPFALCACPSGRGHDLAAPVHDVSCRVHDPPTLHLTLSLDAPRRGAQHPVGDAWRPQFGTVRGALSYFASGALPSGLCAGAAQSGDRADAMRTSLAHLLLGRRE